MMILESPLTFIWHGQIYVLVAVAILEECCMAYADMQCLFYSGERIVVHEPLVITTFIFSKVYTYFVTDTVFTLSIGTDRPG